MPTIDERIVEMHFSNKQFEEGVATSIKSLERLKEALNLDETIDSLKEFENATGQLNLSNIDTAAQNINSTFTLLGKTIDTFRGDIAKKISGIAGNVIGKAKDIALTGLGIKDMSAGFDKYALKTKAVQTIMNATGKSLEEVQSVLGDLMEYTDETSYDFTRMSETIGKFVSSGVDLNVAEKAMEGIGNAAALAGAGISEANHAMYNLSQALAAGVVKKQDWNSIVNANMSTKEFKEEIIKSAIELGVLEKQSDTVGTIVKTNQSKLIAAENALAKAQAMTGKSAVNQQEAIAAAQQRIADATKETVVNFQTFDSTLSEDWLTSDVLIHALEKFSNRSSELGQRAYEAAQKALTFNDAIQAIKDALSSGWMQSFEYIFGDLEEAKDLWTDFCNNIIEFIGIFSSARNDILKMWHDLGGYNDILEAAGNLWEIFMDSVYAARDALLAIFPGLEYAGVYLADLSKNIRDVTARWRKLIGYERQVEKETEEINEEVEESNKDADWSGGYLSELDAKEIVKRHQAMAFSITGIYSDLKRGMRGEEVKKLQEQLYKTGYLADESMADGIYGPKTQEALRRFQADLGIDQTGVFDKTTKNTIMATKALVNEEEKSAEAARRAANVKIDMGDEEKEAVEEEEKFTTNAMYRIQDTIGGLFSLLKLFTIPVKVVLNTITSVVKTVAPLGDAVLTIFSFLGRAITGFSNLIDESAIISFFDIMTEARLRPIANAIQAITNFINDVFGKYEDFNSISDFFENFIYVIGEGNPVVQELVSILGSIGGRIIENVTNYIGLISTLVGWVGSKLYGAVKWIWEILPNVLLILANGINSIITAISNSGIIKEIFDGIVLAIITVISWISKIGSSINKFFKNNNGIKNFSDLLNSLEEYTSKNKLLNSVVKLISGIRNSIQKLKPYLKTLGTFVSNFISSGIVKAIDWLQNGLPVVIDGFTEFITQTYTAAKNSEFLRGVWSGIVVFFGGLGSTILKFAGLISGALKSLFVNDDGSYANPFEKISEKVSNAKDAITSFADTVKAKFKEIYDSSDFIRNLYDSYLKPFWDKFTNLATILRDGLVSFVTADTSDVDGLIPKLQKRLAGFNSLIDWVKERAGELGTAIGDFIKNFSFENIISGIIDTFKAIGSLGSAKAEVWDPLNREVTEIEKDVQSGGIFDRVLEGLKNFGVNFDSVKNFLFGKFESTDFDGKEILHYIGQGLKLFALLKVALSISKVGKGFKKASKGLFVLFTGVNKTLSDLGSSMGGMFSTLGGAFKDFLVGNKDKKITGLSDSIAEFVEKINEAKNVRPKDSIGDAMVKIAVSLLMIAGAVALIANIKDPMNVLKGVGVLIGTVVVLTTAAKILSGKNSKIDEIGKGMLEIVASIGVLALSLQLMNGVVSHADPNDLKTSILIIGGLLGGLTLLSFILNKFNSKSGGDDDKEAEETETKITGILSMCAGIWVLVNAIGSLVKLRKEYTPAKVDEAFDIIKSFITRFSLLEIILAAISRLGTANVGSISVQISGIQSMCTGIWLLAQAMGKVAKDMKSSKNYDRAFEIIRSFVTRLSVLEIVLAAISRLGRRKLGAIDINISGIQSMCTGILLLTLAIDRVASGLTKSKSYEAAFDMILSLIGKLGRLEIALALVNKGSVLKISGVLAMCAGIGIIVYAIASLADYYDYYARHTADGQKINSLEIAFSMVSSIIRTLAIFMAATSATVAKLALIPVAAIAKALLNLSMVIGVIVGIFVILSELAYLINYFTNGDFANTMADGANTIGRAIGAFIRGIILPFTEHEEISKKPITLAEMIEELATNLDKAFDAMWPFLEKVKSVTREHRVGVGNFIVAILEMIGADFLDSIASFVSRLTDDSSGSAFVDFANHLVDLIDPLSKLGERGVIVKKDGIENMIPVMQSLGEVAKAMSRIGWEELKQSVFAIVSGDLSGYWFIQDLNKMIFPLWILSKGSRILNSADIEKFIPIFDAISSVAKCITRIGWENVKEEVFKIFSLGHDVYSFIDNLVKMIPNLLALGISASLINVDSIENVSKAITALGDAARTVPEAGGLIQDIVGNHDLKKFGDQLGALGYGLYCFYNNTKDVPSEYNPSGSVAALTSIASVADAVPKVDGMLQTLIGEQKLGKFGEQLGTLGKGLKDFYDAANKDQIPEDFSVDGLTTALEKLGDLEGTLERHGGWAQYIGGEKDLGKFGEGIGKLGTNMLTFYNSISEIDATKIYLMSESLKVLAQDLSYVPDIGVVEHSVSNLQLIMDSIANLDYTNFENTAKNIIKNINKGLTESEDESPVLALTQIYKEMYTAGLGFFEKFKNLGKFIDLGVAVGIKKNKDLVINAMTEVMNDTLAAAEKTWDSHSPARKGIKLGKNWDKGVAIGLKDNVNLIADSMEDTMDKGNKKAFKHVAEKGEDTAKVFVEGFDKELENSKKEFLEDVPDEIKDDVSSYYDEIYGTIRMTGEELNGTLDSLTDTDIDWFGDLENQAGDAIENIKSVKDEWEEGAREWASNKNGLFGKIANKTVDFIFGSKDDSKGAEDEAKEEIKELKNTKKKYDKTIKEYDGSIKGEAIEALKKFDRWNPEDGNIMLKDSENNKAYESLYDVYGNQFKKIFDGNGKVISFEIELNKNDWPYGDSKQAKRIKDLMYEGEKYLDAVAKAKDESIEGTIKSNVFSDKNGRITYSNLHVDPAGNPVLFDPERMQKYMKNGYTQAEAVIAAEMDYINAIRKRSEELQQTEGLGYYDSYKKASDEYYSSQETKDKEMREKTRESAEAARAAIIDLFENLASGKIDIKDINLDSIGGLSGLKKVVDIISDPDYMKHQNNLNNLSKLGETISGSVNGYIELFGDSLEDAYANAEKDIINGDSISKIVDRSKIKKDIDKDINKLIKDLGGKDALRDKFAAGGFESDSAIEYLKLGLKELGKNDKQAENIIDQIIAWTGAVIDEKIEPIEKSVDKLKTDNLEGSKGEKGYKGYTADKRGNGKKLLHNEDDETDNISTDVEDAITPIKRGLLTFKDNTAGIREDALEFADNVKEPALDVGAFLLKLFGFDRHGMIQNLRNGTATTEKFDKDALFESITPFIDGTGKALDNTGEGIKNIIKSIVGFAGGAANDIANNMEGPISVVSKAANDAFSNAGDAGKALLTTFRDIRYSSDFPMLKIFSDAKAEAEDTEKKTTQVVDSMKINFESLAKELGVSFDEALLGAGNGLKEKGIDLSNVSVSGLNADQIADSIANGIESSSNVRMTSTAKSIIQQIAQSMLDNNSQFLSIGSDTINAVDKGLIDNSSKVSDTATSIMKDVKNEVTKDDEKGTISNTYFWIGEMMMMGLSRGLSEKSSIVTNVAKTVARKAYNAACAELGIHSPSEEFSWVGEMVCEGFKKGLTDYSSMVSQAASQVSGSALDSALIGIEGLYNILTSEAPITPTIRPVVEGGYDSGYSVNSDTKVMEEVTKLNTSSELATNIAGAIYADINAMRMSVEKGNADIINEFKNLSGRIDILDRDILNMKIYLDSDAIVAGTVSKMDRALGQRHMTYSGGRR